MPVTLSIVESTTELNTVVTEVILESASAPGPPGVGVPAGGTTGQTLVKASDTDYDTEWAAGGSGADDQTAAEVPFTPAGNLAATDVQEALEELDAEKAAASHSHSGSDITSGTVAEARIHADIARDAEVTAAIAALSTVYQPLDSDLTAVAALTTTAFGRGLLELANAAALLSAAGAQAADSDLTAIAGLSPSNDDVIQRKAGAWANRTLAQLLTDLAALGTTFQPLDSDLTSIAALTTTSFGRGLLELANQAALLAAAGAAAAAHTHAAGDITSGSLALARGGTGASLADPNADRVLFWDDSAGAVTFLTIGSGLAITDTTLDFAADMATQAELDAHINDSSDAHDASAISIADAGNDFTATDVEGALAELQSDHETDAQNLADHIADSSAAHAASAISVADSGGYFAASDVEAALQEVLAGVFDQDTYTPTLTASSVDPTMGSGSSAFGRYMRIGNLVIAWGQIVFGTSGVAAGTGNYRISLPVSAAVNVTPRLGVVILNDNSVAGNFSLGAAVVIDGEETYFYMQRHGSSSFIGAVVPWTWAASDDISFFVIYPAG